jgi:hypothetical protein
MSPLVQILAEANKPAPAPTPATVYPTNVASIYNNYDQAQMDAYKAQIAQQNAQFGGLASLGSAAIGAGGKLLAGGAAGAGAIPGAIGATSVGGAPLVASGASGLTQAIASALPFLFA